MKITIYLDSDFMNCNIDDVLYSSLFLMASFDQEEECMAIDEDVIKNNVDRLRMASNSNFDTIKNKLDSYVEHGLLTTSDYYDEEEDRDIKHYMYSFRKGATYQKVTPKAIDYLLDYRCKNLIKTYAYLLNRYLWYSQNNKDFSFSSFTVSKALGYETVSETVKRAIDILIDAKIIRVKKELSYMVKNGKKIRYYKYKLKNVLEEFDIENTTPIEKSKDIRVNPYCVYKHTCRDNGKVYIGLTRQIPRTRRWGINGTGYYSNESFYEDIVKYGWDNFDHEILADDLCRDDASDLEIKYIEQYNATNPEFGYNKMIGGI